MIFLYQSHQSLISSEGCILLSFSSSSSSFNLDSSAAGSKDFPFRCFGDLKLDSSVPVVWLIADERLLVTFSLIHRLGVSTTVSELDRWSGLGVWIRGRASTKDAESSFGGWVGDEEGELSSVSFDFASVVLAKDSSSSVGLLMDSKSSSSFWRVSSNSFSFWSPFLVKSYY